MGPICSAGPGFELLSPRAAESNTGAPHVWALAGCIDVGMLRL